MVQFPLLHNPIAITKPLERPNVDVEIQTSIDPAIIEDSYVYVHCDFPIQSPGMLVRVWKSTFLMDQHSSARAELVHAENISYAPQWTMIPDSGTYSFLLIFSSLPKSCIMFDMVEDIPQAGGFLVKNIVRNNKDVYRVVIE